MQYEKLFAFDGQKKFVLRDWKTDETPGFAHKETAANEIRANIEQLAQMQSKLYAQDRYAILLVFQAMDAAGKDSTIAHVMSGINPQGCQVFSFKTPSAQELDHDYLWRIHACVPERGRIGIFNRSYYEEVLVTKVHPEFVLGERIPGIETLEDIGPGFWRDRYEDISNFEDYLHRNGVIILKFFLHVSKEEQKVRFLDRIERKEKHWKFSAADMKERALWDDYQNAYEQAIAHTATDRNPWYIVPADKKWFTRLAVSEIINERLQKLDLAYPTLTPAEEQALAQIKEQLLREN